MQIQLDGQSVADTFAQEGTLMEALNHIQSQLCPPDHMVVGISCDGKTIPSEDMEVALAKPASSFDTLEVVTSTKELLVVDVMSEASESLQETEAACRRTAELFAEDKSAEAVKTFGECLRIWQQINDAAAKSIAILELDTERVMIRDDTLADVLAQPKGMLLQIKQALEVKDHVLLADILLYEFSEVIDAWHSVIACLRQHAEEKNADPK